VEVEVPAIEQRVSAVAAAVGARVNDVTQDLVGHLTREIDPLRDDERVMSLLSASVAENVATLLHAFEHGIDPGGVETPAAAIEYARRLAQRGVPIVALVRAYRIGQARFLQWCFDELRNDPADPHVVSEATRRMTELSFTYIDRISEQVIAVYEAEHDRWLHNRASVRAALVRSLLTATHADVDAAEAALGYRLRRDHLGLVAWTREPTRGSDELLVLERAAATLAQRIGARGKPLFVPSDESSASIWLPLGPANALRPTCSRMRWRTVMSASRSASQAPASTGSARRMSKPCEHRPWRWRQGPEVRGSPSSRTCGRSR
jgi:diguanylate cyclase with GGDEF domain